MCALIQLDQTKETVEVTELQIFSVLTLRIKFRSVIQNRLT